jgi:hypothetical protein
MSNAVRSAAGSIDRQAIGPWRSWRLRRGLDAIGASDEQRRRVVQAELRRQVAWYGPHVAMPEWARDLVLFGKLPGPLVSPVCHRSDADAVRALVLYLHHRRGFPVSLAARDFAAHQPGLGERWADVAIKRLAAAGVIHKVRSGSGRLPAWRLVELDEALGLLEQVSRDPRG